MKKQLINYRTIAGGVSSELWRMVKAKAAMEGKYVYQWVNEAIMEKLDKETLNKKEE